MSPCNAIGDREKQSLSQCDIYSDNEEAIVAPDFACRAALSLSHSAQLREPLKAPPDVTDHRQETDSKGHVISSVVAFDPIVSVVPIPSHTEYSDQVRGRLWADQKEIAEMASRNSLEFAAEGCNWRDALDEDDMLQVGGEHVHPIHANPLLAAALLRKIPYPRAAPAWDEDGGCIGGYHSSCPTTSTGASCEIDDAESGAVYALDYPVERPASPFLESSFDQLDISGTDEHFPGTHGALGDEAGWSAATDVEGRNGWGCHLRPLLP